ncbi:MFS transporter [Fictibacillus sp. 5RED26]|jgi:MFS family permease|uniref:MFS transporter n=1 Tax=Fictibacillus sp. 5RED26 TaxID=2745876 RepID=UPI0018CC8D60|nr:MFS transporter [Fictibacillus sp. 5RED26]MBH0155217.1 MFS transporter [Fictibacillus sp. 5RED26]
MRDAKSKWKYPSLLLSAVGISYIGDFIYLVALNLYIFAKTESVTAVAGLWLIGPLAGIVTSLWSGSLIDRLNKKLIMIISDIMRALLVAIIPFLSEMWMIYSVLFAISLCSSFFNPASSAYTVQLVPKEKWLRYNSISSVLTTGALVIGPAIAGALVHFGSYNFAIWCNAGSFLLSACILSFLPSLYNKQTDSSYSSSSKLKIMIDDWRIVVEFLKKQLLFLATYILFQLIMTLAIALDSQEVVFTQTIIGLTESQYSLLVSITGIGYLTGSLLLAITANKLPIPYLIGFASTLFSLGYGIYAFSNSFYSACIGFIILGFFSSFANTGFQTFFQQRIPSNKMGRVGATLGFFQSLTLIITIIFAGLLSEWLSVKEVVIGTSLLIMLFSVTLNVLMFFYHNSKEVYNKNSNQRELAR